MFATENVYIFSLATRKKQGLCDLKGITQKALSFCHKTKKELGGRVCSIERHLVAGVFCQAVCEPDHTRERRFCWFFPIFTSLACVCTTCEHTSPVFLVVCRFAEWFFPFAMTSVGTDADRVWKGLIERIDVVDWQTIEAGRVVFRKPLV